MSRGVINSVKMCLSDPFSRIKWTDQRAIDPDTVLTSTTLAKIGKTAILSQFQLTDCRRSPNWGKLHARDAIEHAPLSLGV